MRGLEQSSMAEHPHSTVSHSTVSYNKNLNFYYIVIISLIHNEYYYHMSGRPTKIAQEAKKMQAEAGKQLAAANAILKQEALKKQNKKQETVKQSIKQPVIKQTVTKQTVTKQTVKQTIQKK